jgi:predicted ATPase
MAQMHQGLAGLLATGQALARPICLVRMAEASGEIGHISQGLQLLAEALAAFEVSGRRDMLTEAYRLQGELLLRQAVPDAMQAEVYFQQAQALARQQQAKAWELRAAMSLARLWQQQGQHAAAYTLLADIHGWFTEGLDTADLQEAQALLEELHDAALVKQAMGISLQQVTATAPCGSTHKQRATKRCASAP